MDTLKILILGYNGVGKSSFIRRILRTSNDDTIHELYCNIRSDDTIKIVINEQSILPTSASDYNGCILMIDVINVYSSIFCESVMKWYTDNDVYTVMCINKCDSNQYSVQLNNLFRYINKFDRLLPMSVYESVYDYLIQPITWIVQNYYGDNTITLS